MKYGSKKLTCQSLQGATLNLDNAFTKFFREKKDSHISNQRKIEYKHSMYHRIIKLISITMKYTFLK